MPDKDVNEAGVADKDVTQAGVPGIDWDALRAVALEEM